MAPIRADSKMTNGNTKVNFKSAEIDENEMKMKDLCKSIKSLIRKNSLTREEKRKSHV